MLKRIGSLWAFFSVLMVSQVFSQSGLLFNVSATGAPATVEMTLCLNGKGPMSCQNYTVAALNVTIVPTVLEQMFPVVGIKINTPGYGIGNIGLDCVAYNNGYCLFSVKSTQPKNLTIITSGLLTLSPSNSLLPAGTLSTLYSETLSASGGVGPYTFTLSDSTLPPGLNLASNGLISGTPTSDGSYTFTVTATDTKSSNIGSQTYSIVVSGSLTLSPTSSTLTPGTQGTAYSQQFTASGGVGLYLYTSAGPLPSGLSLGTAGLLAGTPSASGSFSFNVMATDSGSSDTGSRNYTLQVNPPPYPTLTAVTASNTKPLVFTGTNLGVFQGATYYFYAASIAPPSTCTDSYLIAHPSSSVVTATATSSSSTTTVTTNNIDYGLSDYISFAGATLPACIAICHVGLPYQGQTANCTNTLYTTGS